MNIIIDFLIVLAAFISMEMVAWLAHKYIMHGIGWFLHSDHHKKESEGFLEKNDAFFLIFALPGILGLFFGMNAGYNFLFFIGLGITIYGFAYFMVHEILIHQRIKLFRNVDSVYLKAIRRAHKMHHKHTGKYDGESFGMLWVSWKYFRNTSKNNPA